MTVTITPHHLESLAASHLDPAPRIVGIDCVYRLYPGVVYFSKTYPDGTLLIETRVFASQIDAEVWVTEHERQRRLLHSARVKE